MSFNNLLILKISSRYLYINPSSDNCPINCKGLYKCQHFNTDKIPWIPQ